MEKREKFLNAGYVAFIVPVCVCIICLTLLTHDKKEHKQQKGLGMKYSIQQATIASTILVVVSSNTFI